MLLADCNTDVESTVVSFTYPHRILDIDMSSLLTEDSHCIKFAEISCRKQGSPLIEREREQQSLIFTAICLQLALQLVANLLQFTQQGKETISRVVSTQVN